MIRMKPFIYWCRLTALICLFNQGVLVWGRCPGIEDGNYTLSNQLEDGTILKYQCEEGFYSHPDLARVCNYGKWEPPPRRTRCKPVECPDPAVLENCNVLPSEPKYFYQNQITYECYEGYTLYGPMHRTCLSSGKWSGPHPVCRRESGAHCPDPGVPPGASRTGADFDIGEKVTYTCNDNDMILVGSEERVCKEDRHWSGKEPTCYYQHTYDTPLEVSQEFAGGIINTFASLQTETNVTQEGRKIKLTKSGILNIYIALDISSSIKPEEFESAKKAIITLIDKIASFSVTPNYDVQFFSSKPIEVIDILSFFDNNKKSLAELVAFLKDYKISRRDQAGTNLNAVFEKFLEKMAIIKQRQVNFAEHQHIIIIFTDGGYNMGGRPTATVDRIKSMVLMDQPEREEHLDIYVFAVGAQIYDRNLKGLPFGTGEKHYFRLKDDTDLHETFDEIINEEDIRGLCGLHIDYIDYSVHKDLKTKRKQYPWVVFVNILTSEKTSHCLGSLVSPRFVLTAAHCFTVDDLIIESKVELHDGVQLDVKKIHMHPQYNISAKVKEGIQEFYDYDVALIELTKDVRISLSVRPICLPCTEETNSALRETLTCRQQEQFLIAHNERVNFLTKKRNLDEKVAHIKLDPHRDSCIIKALNATGITTTDVSKVVNENFFCSGGTQPQLDNIACRGDSGGAVFKNYLHRTIQVALVSWGNKVMDKCDERGVEPSDEDSRDFHLNLFKVLDFLKSILGKTDEGYAPLVFVD